MTDVRVKTGSPIVEDFRNPKNSPIVINESTDKAYYNKDNDVRQIKAMAGDVYYNTNTNNVNIHYCSVVALRIGG